MNYLEIINKCLIELDYKQINAFSELIKNDHKRLKNIINVINTEVCSSDRWNFLQRKMTLTVPANTGEVENTVPGRIEGIFVNGEKFEYFQDFEKFFTNTQPSASYSFYDDKILFPLFPKNTSAEILYYTNKCAKSAQGVEKVLLEDSDDESLIPAKFAEPILVYGACMRLKGNPQHIKFNYWLSMYKDALSNMRSRISSSMDETPNVKLFRR